MRWAVAGHPRTGSSALMRLLLTHGLPVLSRGASTPRAFDRRVWELPRRWPQTGLLDLCGGRAVKVFWRDLQWMAEGVAESFTVVRLVRDPGEVAESWRRCGADVTAAEVSARFDQVAAVWPDAPVVDQVTLRDDPQRVLTVLAEHGWPLATTPGGRLVDRVLIRDRSTATTIRESVFV